MALYSEIQKHVVGRRIVRMLLNRSFDPQSRKWYYDPSIALDNGVVIRFFTQETQVGDYGVEPVIYAPLTPKRHTK